jgi:hypothetical protein
MRRELTAQEKQARDKAWEIVSAKNLAELTF